MNHISSISVVLIVKNEGHGIEDCLESVSWADEIVVLDSGSTDETVNIAKKYTDLVYVNSDWHGYGIQRQRAQSKAKGDWILMLDADERVTLPLITEIQNIIALNDQTKVYEIPILPWCFGRFIRHGGWYPGYTIRLYPRTKAQYGDERVHERPKFRARLEVVRLKNDILHYTYRDLEHYLVKSAKYAAEWSRERFEKGKRTTLFSCLLHGTACFIKMYVIKLGFLDGPQGLLLALLSAHSTFVKHANLWTRQQAIVD